MNTATVEQYREALLVIAASAMNAGKANSAARIMERVKQLGRAK